MNPIALRKAKTLWSFGSSECNRVKKTEANMKLKELFPLNRTHSPVSLKVFTQSQNLR